MDLIKEAFQKIKEDILLIKTELLDLQEQIFDLKNKQITLPQSQITSQEQTIPTQNSPQMTQQTDRQTQNMPLEPFSYPNSPVSIGNRGVPTDRQTNQQTDRQTQNPSQMASYTNNPDVIDDFERANKILDSLDNIKKEIRLKFKRLTPQEMLVFSTLYSLEDQKTSEITYKLLAKQLNLSESSIRDYINKLIKKGVPIQKIRQNNKTVTLEISQDLKNIANLATIINLRAL
jgi:DNA-binding MarR family transcriptional regulator